MDLVSLGMKIHQIDFATKLYSSVTKVVIYNIIQLATHMTNMISEIINPNIWNYNRYKSLVLNLKGRK